MFSIGFYIHVGTSTKMFKKGNMKLYFDSKAILRALVRNIRSSERVYGCIAWVTHPKLLDELEKIPTELIMTKHRCNKWKRRIKVKFLGSGRGKKKVLMHHKFICGFRGKKAAWCAFGSFNYTKSAVRHHENCMFVQDPDVAQAFYEEFLKLKAL